MNGRQHRAENFFSARTAAPAPKAGSRTREDKDQPLFQDIRYLGRLLGDVVREQEQPTGSELIKCVAQNRNLPLLQIGEILWFQLPFDLGISRQRARARIQYERLAAGRYGNEKEGTLKLRIEIGLKEAMRQ